MHELAKRTRSRRVVGLFGIALLCALVFAQSPVATSASTSPTDETSLGNAPHESAIDDTSTTPAPTSPAQDSAWLPSAYSEDSSRDIVDSAPLPPDLVLSISAPEDDGYQLHGHPSTTVGGAALWISDNGRTVGLRFNDVCIADPAQVGPTRLDLVGDRGQSESGNLVFSGLDVDDVESFTSSTDLANAARTSVSVSYEAPAFETDLVVSSPDLGGIVREIIGRERWTACNSIGLLIEGSALRSIRTFESGGAATLTIGPMPDDWFPQAVSIPVGSDTHPTYSLGPEPGLREPILDRVTGANVARLTENQARELPTRYRYSSQQAFNADGSVIFLQKGNVFIDSGTLQRIDVSTAIVSSLDTPQWSPTDPREMIGARGSEVLVFEPLTERITAQIPLPTGYEDAQFNVRTSPSYDGTRVVVKARDRTGRWHALGLDLETQEFTAPIAFADHGFASGGSCGELPQAEFKLRTATASPSGDLVILFGCRDNEQYGLTALDWDDPTTVVYRSQNNNGVECPGGHGDFALSDAGHDVYTGICKSGGAAWSAPYANEIIVLDLWTGAALGIPLPNGAAHVSARNSGRPGWAYGSHFTNNSHEGIFAYKLDGSRVEYYFDPQAADYVGPDYQAETQALPSPDGTKVLFMSTWEGALATGDVFLLDLTTITSSDS